MQYPAAFVQEPGCIVVTFRDIPEAVTQGDDEAEAVEMAKEVLMLAMGVYFKEKRTVPAPSELVEGERLIGLPPSVSAKVALLNEMLKQKVRPAELARRIGLKEQEAARIVNLDHKTNIDTLGRAMDALGRHLDIRVA